MRHNLSYMPLPIVHHRCHGNPLFTWYYRLKKWIIVISLATFKEWSLKLVHRPYLERRCQYMNFGTSNHLIWRHNHVIWFGRNTLQIVEFEPLLLVFTYQIQILHKVFYRPPKLIYIINSHLNYSSQAKTQSYTILTPLFDGACT